MNILLKKKYLLIAIFAAMLIGAVWFFAGDALAQNVDTGLNFATETGLSNTDPRIVIARIIRIILGFLGIIAVGIIIYAGFIWMTAQGDEEKIAQAKKILISAVIGLVIVVASFGIATFIMSRLTGATGGNGGNGGGGGGGGLGGGQAAFLISGVTPAKQAVNVPRNAVIRLRFSKTLVPESVSDSTVSVSVAGQRSVSGNYVEFVPDANCEEPDETLKCFPANTVVTVTVANGANGVRSTDNKELDCANGLCSTSFTVGEFVDTEAPRVNITTQQICSSMQNALRASSIDDYGVSKIDFFTNQNPAGSVINSSNPFVGSPFEAQVQIDPSGYGESVFVKATAYDLDTNQTSAEKDIPIVPAHCCNGILDGDETGIDCGGSCISCSAFDRPSISSVTPAGGFCSNDVNKFCRQNADCGANISCDMGTPNGATGNFVTILGSGFGEFKSGSSKVFFTNAGGQPVEAVLADDANSGNPVCINSVWQDKQIIAVVPSGAENGKISITTSEGKTDATDDDFGSLLNNFKKNTINRPGVCALTPSKGKLNDLVEYQGIKLSASEAYYGNLSNNVKAITSSFTSEKEGTATVPNLTSGDTTTYVSKADVGSNFLAFTKENEPYDGPIISSVEPLTGPVGQYVTVRGSGFGGARGTSKVFFGSSTNGFEADYAFPDICAPSIWSNNQIVIKVPSGIPANASYQLSIARDGFPEVNSGTQTFAVTTGSPDPGICRIQPILGQPNSEAVIWGEYFRPKDINSLIRFYNNKDQRDAAITSWAIDNSASGIKPWRAETTVPQAAATGPLRLLVGNPFQASNALNFAVGQCAQDSDCGSGEATCCSAGLPEAGKCKATSAECYGSVATSVYEWQFSTGSTNTCAQDQEQCGTSCCAIGECENAGENKCAQCLSGQNQCGNGDCCNGDCEDPEGGGNSFCADPNSCSGYSYNQCLEGFYCPNSPGMCSPYPGTGDPLVVGQCGNDVCNSKPGCANGACIYDTALNLCVKNNTDSCRRTQLLDNNGLVIKLLSNGQIVAGQCALLNNDPLWHLTNFTQSCPVGWQSLGNNRCVDVNRINGACSVCSTPFACKTAVNGTDGKCSINQPVCPSGSTCSNGECKQPDQGRCECCCDKDHPERDCCSALIQAGGTCAGSCGSGQSNLGLCSGCAPGGIPNDDLCNCTGTTGKFCSVNAQFPTGACVDCASITDPNECSSHSQCCVDGKNQNRCTSVPDGGARFEGKDTLQYCAYYNCTNSYPNLCNATPDITGIYNKLNNCEQGCESAPISCANNVGQCDKDSPCPMNMRCDPLSCECKSDSPGPGLACRDPFTNACTGSCTVGYQCLLPSYGNTTSGPNAPSGPAEASSGPGTEEDTCRCCCKPPKAGQADTCKQINPGLNCLADQGLCTSPTGERGLCCGCTADAMCGDVLTTGCGLTGGRCCQTRPLVVEHVPPIGAQDVCRNAAIEAVFNQKMDIASFSDHVRLIADYGKEECGFSPVASLPRPDTFFAGLLYSVKKVMSQVFPAVLTQRAFADFSNYCYVPGTPVAYDISPTQTKVSFRLTTALKENINYYVVLMGDPDLATVGQGDEKDYYNLNIVSAAKIGMVGGVNGNLPDTFNSTEFKNSEIWSFRTGNDVCSLERVSINPSFQLFQRSGQSENFEASARDRNNRVIQPIANYYNWDWNWSTDDTDVATVAAQANTYQAIATAGNKQDAQTFARGKATIIADEVNEPDTIGDSREGIAQLRLFLCENPWPVYYSQNFPPGYQWPWQDPATGLEFYYCRDKSGVGTIDDLPALVDEPIIKEGGRKICMYGANAGKVCTSDTNCGAAGSCLPEVLKEFFFFRETEPGIPTITGTADALGKQVTLRWQPVPNASKYKIYYGTNPGQYVYTTEVPALGKEMTKTITGLANGLHYYFAMTAISAKNQESVYSNELKIKPADKIAPAIPSFQVSSGDGRISLFWPKVPEATSYIAYIGVQPRNGGQYTFSVPVPTDPAANQPNVVFTSAGTGGLNNSATYYVSVRSVDQYGNISDYAGEIAKKPDEPYLISATASNGAVLLKWLPFINATGYTIYYGEKPATTDEEVTVSSTTLERNITGLSNNTTYYFRIKASRSGGMSAFSNERSAQPGSNDQ